MVYSNQTVFINQPEFQKPNRRFPANKLFLSKHTRLSNQTVFKQPYRFSATKTAVLQPPNRFTSTKPFLSHTTVFEQPSRTLVFNSMISWRCV